MQAVQQDDKFSGEIHELLMTILYEDAAFFDMLIKY
jgi:hypothetical protein